MVVSIRRSVTFAALALLAAGCAVQPEIHAVMGPEREEFTGKALIIEKHGNVTMTNGHGVDCIGELAFTGLSTGHAFLTCNNGETARLQFRSLGLTSGYGYGVSSAGRQIRFYAGLSPSEGAPYLGGAVGTSAASAQAPQSSAQKMVTSIGTGFYISRQGHLLTNAHVVEGCTEVTVSRVGAQPMNGTIVARDKENDLALLQVSSPPPAVAMLRDVRTLRQGEPVVAFGFGLNGIVSSGGALTTGNVSALSGIRDDSRYLQTSAPIQPGNSGGPLMDMTGAVVGMNSTGLNAAKIMQVTGAVPQNVKFALKVSVMKTFLDSSGVAPEYSSGGRELSTPDIGERARSFSVLIQCKG